MKANELRFGFIENHSGYMIQQKEIADFIISDLGYESGWTYTAGEGLRLSMQILYVHQLQNLYFALTGKELEVK